MQTLDSKAVALGPIIDRLNRERAEHEADVRLVMESFGLREIGAVISAFGGALMEWQGRAGDGSPLHDVDFRALEDAAEAAGVEAERLLGEMAEDA